DLHSKLIDVITGGAVKSQFFDPDNANAQSNDFLPTSACSHGTRSSSIAAAASNNGLGIAGVSWGAQLLSLRVFNGNDTVNDQCAAIPDSTVVAAINYATTLQNAAGVGHLVINMSLG